MASSRRNERDSSAPGFDRAAFHRQFNAAVVAFFEKTFN
jgi:predicted dienelactone hydrolase